MFENLQKRLTETVNRLRGRGRLSEENVREALRLSLIHIWTLPTSDLV